MNSRMAGDFLAFEGSKGKNPEPLKTFNDVQKEIQTYTPNNYNLSQKIDHISKKGETYKYDNLNRTKYGR